MDADRVIDVGLTLLSLGVSAYLGYSTMKRLGLIRRWTTVTVRGVRISLTFEEGELFKECVVDPQQLTQTFESVGGHQEVKNVILQNVITPFQYPALFQQSSLRMPPKGLLLYGPPGTGKTMLARAIAREANAFFMDIRIESLFSKWVGETEQNIAALFKIAQLCQPTIMFIDEIDALLSERSESSSSAVYNNVKTIFLRHWDGFRSASDRIVVIGATNVPHVLDQAVLRRLSIQIQVPLPSALERREILKISLQDENIDELDFDELVQMTEGFSGSDIKALCTEACGHMIHTAVQRLSSKDITTFTGSNEELLQTLKMNMSDFTYSMGHRKKSSALRSKRNFCATLD